MSRTKSSNNSKSVHESYHRKTMAQYKVIDDKNFTYRIILSLINKYLRGGGRVLDIGCGAGTIDFYLANKGYSITGIDISQTAIEACNKTARNLGLQNIYFKQIDFPRERINGKFDFVICSEVLEHLENDRFALKQIYKLLKKDGILILTTPSIDAPLHKLGLTKEFDKKVGHLRRYRIENLLKMISDSGFEITKSKITEGPLRNFLFVNPVAGKFVRFVKFFMSDIVTSIDNVSAKIFGGSDIMVVARKVEA